MKQETLEEAAESRFGTDMDSIRGSNVHDLNTDLKRGFIEGAKWQAEKMYSEEDMTAKEILFKHWCKWMKQTHDMDNLTVEDMNETSWDFFLTAMEEYATQQVNFISLNLPVMRSLPADCIHYNLAKQDACAEKNVCERCRQ